MSKILDRSEVVRMLARDAAKLVEVLPREEYEAEHIVGAACIPLKELASGAADQLDRDRPVIVYCEDSL